MEILNYKQAVEVIYKWRHDHTYNNFYNQLVTLISRADPENREKLRIAFPLIVAAYEDWLAASQSGDQLFIDMGII